jgi:hypothetical protein
VSTQNRQTYVEAVLSLYRRLPDTATRPRRADRRLAVQLHRRGIALDVIEIALRLAAARRRARAPDAQPLPPIRSLHYFLPLIEELPAGPPPDGYLDYLREVAPDKTPTPVPVTSLPNLARSPRRPPTNPRQLRLPIDPGAPQENDVS